MTETTTERTERDLRIIAEFEGHLLDGTVFRRIAASHRSVRLGGPAIDARSFSNTITAIGRLMAEGDLFVAVGSKMIRKANPYTTSNEVIAQVAEGIAEFIREGYFDVIGATGPEASRPSAHQHTVTLTQAITLAVLMAEVSGGISGAAGDTGGLGWCLDALVERERVGIYAHRFPLVAAKRAK